MHRNSGLQLDRQGDTLILTSRIKTGWSGAIVSALVIAFALAWLFFVWGGALSGNAFAYVIAVLGSLIFGMMFFLMLPHEVTTVFDLRSRSVLRTRSVAAGLYKRRRTHGFGDVAGLGIKEYGSDGSYRPVMALRTGETLRLSTFGFSGGYLSYAKTIADICAATGLQQIDVPSRHSNSALQLDRQGDTLILTSRTKTGWISAPVIVSVVAWLLLAWGSQLSRRTAFDYALLLFGAAFVGSVVFAVLPHEVTTVFDLRSRSVLHTRRIAGGWFERRRTYSFAEIAGLGIREYRGEGYSYRPVMTLRTGETVRLSPLYALGGGYPSYAKTIADVCAATGLQQVDVPYRLWWKRR